MTAPLLLRLAPPDGVGDQFVIAAPADIKFSTMLPGGYDTMTCTIPWRTRTLAPSAFSPLSLAQVLDRRTGGRVWEGRITDPGLTTQDEGDSYVVTAIGHKTIGDGTRAAYALVDRDPAGWVALGDWAAGQSSTDSGAGFGADPGDWVTSAPTYSLVSSIPQGQDIDTGDGDSWVYRTAANIGDVGSDIAAVAGSSIISLTDGTDQYSQVAVGPSTFSTSVSVSNDWSATTQWNWLVYYGTGAWPTSPTPVKAVRIRWWHTGSLGAFPSDVTQRWSNLRVFGHRYARDGSDVALTSSSATRVTTATVMDDLIGRTKIFDAGPLYRSSVPSSVTSTTIAQAAWWTGVSATEVLAFVLSSSPDTWWACWELTGTGKPRFEWRAWSTTLRYILGPDQAKASLSGGADNLANTALVIFKNGDGDFVTTLRCSVDVPVLDAAGITRTLTVDLTDRGPMAPIDAYGLGLAHLRMASLSKTSGTLTITGPIMDRVLGRRVHPWELQAGDLVQWGQPDSMSDPVTGSDGATIFRVTGTSYDASSQSATLQLDGGAKSLISRLRVEVQAGRYDTTDARVGR